MMKRLFSLRLQEAARFTMERQKAEGGFGATPRLPATLEDTFHALKILKAVEGYCGLPTNAAVDREGILNFLQEFSDRWNRKSPKAFYQLAWCLKACNAPEATIRPLVQGPLPYSACRTQEGLYHLIKAARLLETYGHQLCGPLDVKKFVSFEGILFRRWTALFIQQDTGVRLIEREEARSWFLACRNYDGGFGFLPGSTSYLENTRFALEALAVLGHTLASPWETVEFVLACQSKAGGFSRRADAAPFLDATWHGTASLIMLSHSLCRHGSIPETEEKSAFAGWHDCHQT